MKSGIQYDRLDALVFSEQVQGSDDDLALQLEAVTESTQAENQTVRERLKGMILKHEARRRDSARVEAAVPAKKRAAAGKRGPPVA